MEHVHHRRVSAGTLAALIAVWGLILAVPPVILLSQRDAWLQTRLRWDGSFPGASRSA